MGRLTKSSARQLAAQTPHLGGGGRLWRRTAAAAGGRAAGLTLSAVRVFARLFSPKLFAVAFVLGGALSAQSAFAFGAVSSVGRFLRGRMRGVGASGFPLSAVRGFLQLFSPKLFAVAFVLCGALSAQSAFAFGAIAAGGSGSNPSHGVAINQATRAGADAEALRLCEAGGADCHLIRRFINLCAIAVADSDATTDLAGIPSGTLATGSQAQAAGFYSHTYPSTANANTARTQAVFQCTNFGGTSCAAIAGASGCDTTTIPSCPAGQGVDIVESSICGVCPLARPIVHTTGPGGTAGVCRGAFNQGECTALDATYHYDSQTGACRVRVAADCGGFTPIYVSASNTCRAAANDDECKAIDQTLEKVGNRCLNICTSGTQVRDSVTEGCRTVENANDCTGTPTPIFVSASTTCRAATNQAECTALTGGSALMFDGGACRDRVASDCAAPNGFFVSASKTCRPATQADCDATTATPILQNGACRAATNQGECSALTGGSALVFDGGACRDRVAGDCAGTTPIFVSASKTCREARQEDCTGNTPILDNGACRTRQMNDCPNHAPVLDGGTCRPRQLGDTFGAYYEYERTTTDTDGSLSRFINGGFAVNQPTPEAAAAAALADCQFRFNAFDGTTIIRECAEAVAGGFNDMCINNAGLSNAPLVAIFGIGATPAAAIADRISKVAAGTSFRSATRAACDCGGATPIVDGNTCKAAATQAECTAVHAGLVFESGGTCRPRTASECTGNTPILGNDGVCRAATKEECAAIPATPVSNNNGGCREATNAGECPSATPFYDDDASGNCRAPHSGDNYGAYYHFTRFGGINNGGISFNHPTQEAANAAAKAACESRRDDFGGGTSACNPHPRVRNGFTQCINTAETGPVRYVGLGATPLAARLDRQAQPGSGTAGHNNNNPQNACNCGDGETPDGDNCRPTTSADCTGLRPIFDGGNCRARTPAECPANRPIVDATTGNCREMREVDCTGNTPILDGITCRAAANNAECLFKSRALRYDGAQSCRAATQADCTGTAAPIFDANSGACRVRIASDCSAPTPDISKGVCVAACAAGTPVRDATSEECRATIQTDCDGTGTPILDGTACRAAVQTDCDGTATPILDGGICRARNAADCTTAAAPVLDSTSGNCRAATTAAECPFGLPILDGGVCRAATQADCDATPATPVLDIGGCRAPRAGDTFGAYYTFTAGSQLINGRFVVNQPTPEAAATEARRACEAVRAGSIGGLFGNPSACAPDSSAPNGFNGVCINTGEVGPRRFVGYGATPAAALAARAAQSGNRNVNFPIAACDCSANQIRSGNDCQPRTSAATCTGSTPIFDRGFCREVRAEDCSGNTPIFDGGVCRGARPGQGECTGRTPIADGGACRAAVSVEDCAGVNALLLPAGDGSCRPKQQSDCTGLTPILDGGLCRAMQARDCVAPTPFLDLATNQCREAVAADCGGDTPIFDSNTCRAAVAADCDGTATPDLLNGRCYAACPSGTPVRDSTTRLCRIAEASDCGGGTPVFESGVCRAQRADECTGTTPILDGGACRGAATDDDCGTINIVLVRVSDGSCRERVAADCVAGPTPIFDEAKICRAALSQEECTAKDRALLYETGGTCRLRTQADCTDVQVLDGGVCRARVLADCTGETPILEDGQCRAAANQNDCTAKHTSLVYESNGSCRTRVLADCTPERPILDATRGVCREVGSADCPSALPIFDTGTESCRAARQADCDATPDTPILDGGRCRAFQASDCPATHLFENNGCRARTSADCTGATPRFDGGFCFPESAFESYGAYFDYEGEISGIQARGGAFVVNRPTAAQANTDALTACSAASARIASFGASITRACAEAATFRRCINIASGRLDNIQYFGVGDTPAAAIADRQAKHPGQRTTGESAACNCGGAMSIADSNAPGGCRAAIQADCTGNTPILAPNGLCRAAANQAECTAIADNLQIDSGACRPRTAADCAATEVFTGAVCRARQTSDCTGTTPILENGNCRAATSNLECSRKSPNLQLGSGGACAERDTHFSAVWVATFSQSDGTNHDFIAIAVNQPSFGEAASKAREACEALNEGIAQIGTCRQLVIPSPNNQCVDLRRAVLNNGDFKYASGIGATPDLARQNREQNAASGNPENFASWRSAGGSDSEAFCDCGGSLGSVASGTGSGASCRARVAADCTGSTPVLEGGVCRAATIAECTTDKPILQNGACRARIDSDCTGTTSILENNACRPAANQAECTAKHTRFVFARGGICRERTKADCSAALPVLDAVSGQCRARVASDCTGFTPALINGICQPGMHGAVAIGTIALNISPVNLGALTNPAHPQYSTANGTIQVYGASRLQKSAADARRLALSACGRAASDHRAAAAGQTGQNCQIVSQFASGVAALWRLATAPYGDHYFSAIATLQINTTTTIATMTMAQNTITTTTTMAVAPTNAEIAAAQAAAEAEAKTACDTFAAAQTSTGQTLTCQSAAAELLRTIPAAEVCGEGAFLDADAIPRACACLPGYDTLVAPSGGLPSCSLSANTPRCDNSKGAFLNADATACVCSSGWGTLDATATPQFCRPPQCDGPSAFLHPTSGRCECAQGYDNLRHSVDAGGNAVFTCIPTTPPTCRADRGAFFNPLEARCDCQTGWENVRPDPSAANTFMCMRIAEADCDSTRGAIINPNYGAAGASQCQCANGFRNLQTETANGGNRYFCEFDPNPTTPIPTCDPAVNLTLNAQRTACECVAGHRDLEGRVPPEVCAPVVARCDITKGAFPTGLGTSCECAPGYHNLNQVNTPQTCSPRCDDDTTTLNSVSGQCECKEGFSDPRLERVGLGSSPANFNRGLVPNYNDVGLEFVCAPTTAPRPVCDESRNAIYNAKHNTCVCRVGPSGAGRPEFGLERKFDSSTNEYYCETANYLTGGEGRLCNPREGSHTNPLIYTTQLGRDGVTPLPIAPCVCDIGYGLPFSEKSRGGGIVPDGIACTANTGQFEPEPRTTLPVCSADKGTRYNADRNDCECIPGYHGNPLIPTGCIPANIPQTSVPDCDAATAQINPRNSRECQCKPGFFNLDDRPAFRTLANGLQVQTPRYFCSSAQEIQVMVSPNPGFSGSDCTAAGFGAVVSDVRYRLPGVTNPVDGQREVCNIDWAEVSADNVPELSDGSTPHVPPANTVNEGTSCVIQQFYKSGENYVSVPLPLNSNLRYCSDLFGGPARAGSLTNISVYAEARAAEINGLTPGTTLVAVYQPSHRLYVATGGGLYTQNGLQINNVPFVIDFVEGFSGADCVRDLTDGRNLGWRATLDLTQNGADRVFRLHCLVDWRETANPPPLRIEAEPPAGTAQGDRCLLGQQPADTPLAANERRCSDMLASACEAPGDPLGCFALIYTAIYDRIWQYNPILSEPETRDFPVVSPTNLPTLYVSGGKVYNANGIESAGPLRFGPSPIPSGFEPADCSRGGWRQQGDITRTSDGDYVLRQYCNVRWRRVPTPPVQGDVITPPTTITAQGERCLIRQSPPGITLAADLELCSDLLGKAGTNFGAVGDEIDLLTEQANLGRAQNIPTPMRRGADTRGSHPLFILPDGRVFSQYGVGTPILDFVGEVSGFARDDCTNAGYRYEVRVTNTAAGESVQLRTCGVPWARAASPPVLSATPAGLSPSARVSLSSSGDDCVIEYSPARLSLPPGTEKCSDLLSPGGANFGQITARIEARRAEINPLLAEADAIPAFTRNSTLIIADGRAFTNTGIEVRDDAVAMSAPAAGYGISDCEAGGWTAMTVAAVVDNKPVIRHLCNVGWRESATPPPFGGTPAPDATKMGDHCTIAHTDSTVTDLLLCSDLFGRAAGGVGTFADLTLRAELRRAEVNALSSESALAGAYAVGVNTLYALSPRGLFTDQGVEISDRTYQVSGADDGWKFADCQQAGRTVGITVSGTGLERVVYQFCELNWVRTAAPPPLATMQAIPTATASGAGCLIAANPPTTTPPANLERCNLLFATEENFEAITVSLAAVRTAVNGLVDPVIPPLPTQALQTLYVVENNPTAANNGVWSANGVGRGLLPFELPDGADNSGFQAKDCTGAWAPAKRGRLSPSNNGTVFNLCNVKWRRTDAPPPILTEAADPVTLAATGRVKEAEFCVIAQRPSNATLPDGYELCTEAFAGRAGQANQNLAAITSQIEARRGEMNNPGSPINFVFPLPRTPNGIPAFAPASQTLQVVTSGGNARIFSPNGVEATDTRFSFTAAQNAAYGLDECRQGRFRLSAQSTVVAGEQQVRIGCQMQWRRLADIPPLSPTALDDTLATSQNDHCVITQWPTNSAFAADSNNQYCGDLLSGIVPDFGEIFDRLQARVIDHNRELSPSPANPATELFPTTTSARVLLFPYFFANNRMFNDRGVEITETAFNMPDAPANFTQTQCNAAGLTLTFQSDVAGGVQRVRSICGVRWASAAAPLPIKHPPEPPTTTAASGDWCVIQQTPAPADWTLPSNLVQCNIAFGAAGNLMNVYQAHDDRAPVINTRWGAGLQTDNQRGNTLYIFGNTYYYPDGVDPRASALPPAPDYGNYTPEHCNTVYGAPEYLGAVVGTLQVLTRTCDVPWRTLADSPPPFAPVAATLALDNRAATSGEACVMALHPSSQAHPPNTIPCSDFEVGSPSFLDISNRIQQRVDQLNGLIFPQSLPDFDPTRPLYFYNGVSPAQLFNENGLQLTGDNFTPPYVGQPAVGFAAADCTAGGWNTGARLIAGGFAEICEIRWRKTTTIPNIDKDAANLPAATSEGGLCVMRHTMTNPTLPEAAPWCSDLLSSIANGGGAFQNLKTRIDGRTEALNAAGAGIPAFDPTSHRVILAGTRAFSEHGAESTTTPALALNTRNAAFSANACAGDPAVNSDTGAGHRLILHSEVSGATHILRQYCDVRWRSGANVPPLAVNPANPPAAFASRGDRCLMATQGTNLPLAGEMWCGDLLSAVDNFGHLYQRYGEWRELANPLISGSLPPARTGGPEVEAGNYETFYHITPGNELYTSNGIPIRRTGLEETQFVRQIDDSFFRATDCTSQGLSLLTLAFNTGRPTGDLLIGRYCEVDWRIAATAPPLDKDATPANLPSPTSQGSRCLIDQTPDFAENPVPDGERRCHDLFNNPAPNVEVDSFSTIYDLLQARRLEINGLAATTDDDFPEIADGAEPLWTVGTPPVIFHSTGIKANKVGLALPAAATGFTAAECNARYGADKASVRITSDPANGQPVVQRICAVEWRRMATAPGLSRAVISGPFTEQGSNCVISQSPAVADTPLPAGQHLCSDLFGRGTPETRGGTGFNDLEFNRQSRTRDVNDILTGDNLPGYFSTANAINPYIVVENVVENRNDVYDIYGVPINSEIYAPTFRGSGASWDAATCHNVIATGDTPPVDIVAGGIAKLCNMRWRRVDSAPDVIFGNPETVPASSLPPQSATATRKQGNQCVWQHTHDSIDDFPNNYELCETLFSAGGTYSGWNNFNLDGYVGPLTQLGVAYGSGLGNGFNTGFATILGTMIFSPYGIQAGGDYSQKGATTNWPTSTLPTPTTICGTNPPVSAVGRSDGQNVIVTCPTQWRRLSEAPNLQTFPYSPRDGNSGTQTAAGDYCIISQSETPTADQTARRCDTVFGDVAGGIQRIIDDAVQSHGFINQALSFPYPVDLTNTGIYWIHGTDIYSPYGVKLQGGTNVDYVLSAEQGGFTGGDCANNGYTRQGFETGRGLYQTCSIRVGYATTPPPLGETANPPASTGDLSNCDLRKTANVPARPERSCSAIFGNYGSSFSNIVAIAEARRTQINTLTGGNIPVLQRGAGTASHRFYIVRTGAARGMYTRNGVPIMDNLRLTAPLGGWTAASCTAAGYTVGGRLSNGNLYQLCKVNAFVRNGRPPRDSTAGYNAAGQTFVENCVIARTPGATLADNEPLCSALLGAPNLGNFADFSDFIAALRERTTESNVIAPAGQYNPGGFSRISGPVYVHPLIIVQTGADAGIYTEYGVKADRQSAYTPQTPGFTIADCTAANWTIRLAGGYVQCQIPYLYVNTPPPLGATPNPPTNTVGGSADCTITATRGSPITNSRRCNVVLGSTSGFQDAITKFNARRDEYNAVFADDIPAFAFNSTVYVVQTGANAGVYTQHGLRATDTRLFAPETDAFTIADCTASGHSIGVASAGGNNFVACEVAIYTVPNKPPLGSSTNPPGNAVIAPRCAITQTPGANPAGNGPTCASLLGDHVSSFSQMVNRFEARRTEYNGAITPDIPAYAPGGSDGIVYRIASGADAGLYTRYGIPASDSNIVNFEAPIRGFTAADCTAAGFTVEGRNDGNNLYQTCSATGATRQTKPPLQAVANVPPSSVGDTSWGNCIIARTPGAPIPASSPLCSAANVYGGINNINSFTEIVNAIRTRTADYNAANDPDIPAYDPAHFTNKGLFVVRTGADAGVYTRNGVPVLPVPVLFDSNINKKDCTDSGRTALAPRTVNGVQLEECSVLFNTGANRPPELAFQPSNPTLPSGGRLYRKCVFAALPQNGALPNDTIKCTDLLSTATSGIVDFVDLRDRYAQRRNQLHALVNPHNTGKAFHAALQLDQRVYLQGGKLYHWNGIEIRPTAYGAGDRSEQRGFTTADCTAAGYTTGTTTTRSTFNDIVWPTNVCNVKHVNMVLAIGLVRVNTQNTKHNPPTSAPPNTQTIPPVQSGCNIGLPVSNAGDAEDALWNRTRCDHLLGSGGNSFTHMLSQIDAVTRAANANQGFSIPTTPPNAHGVADPIFVIFANNGPSTEIQSIYGARVIVSRNAPVGDSIDSILTNPIERFSRQDCVNAGWTASGTGRLGAGDLQEFCNIIWRRRTTTPAPTPPTTPPEEQSAAAAESSLGAFGFQDELDSGGGATYPKLLAAPAFSASSPLAEDEIAPQVHEGEQHKHCITRHDKAAETPPPSDMQCGNVFAQHGGFPDLAVIKKAATDNGLVFDSSTDALSIDENGKVILVKEDESGKMIEVPIPKPLGASPATPASSGGGGGGGGGAAIGIGVGSAAILGLLAYSLQSGAVGAGAGLGEFNWSPDISFAYNNTGMREIRYGTRMDFRHTDWHIWWTASQINSSGETKKMRYGSGAQYSADWWSARYNNSIHDKEARADVALKATGEFRDWGGVWKFSPTYRANVEVDEHNIQTWSHRVNLEAVWRINKWTLTQSTGFTAKKASDIGETLQTRLKLTREF